MKKREIWLDVLRCLCAFLVIVNHTNSYVFIALAPENGTWWVSVAWYALCKVAVPVFVMISGACLLGREDSYAKCLGRFARMVGVLVVFSFVYAWPESLHLGAFIRRLWAGPVTDSFWYLYFYAGLMLMLPFLQRLSCAMRGRDALWLIVLCLGFGSLAPLLEHLHPALALPPYVDVPLFSTWIGLFFAGWQIRRHAAGGKKQLALSVLALALSLAGSVALLYANYAPGIEYWDFMDDRMLPGFLVVVGAIALMMLAAQLLRRPMSARACAVWTELGGCAFGIYLVHGWFIPRTQNSIFLPLSTHLTAFPAVVLWEIAVFLISLLITLVMRRIPLLKKLL